MCAKTLSPVLSGPKRDTSSLRYYSESCKQNEALGIWATREKHLENQADKTYGSLDMVGLTVPTNFSLCFFTPCPWPWESHLRAVCLPTHCLESHNTQRACYGSSPHSWCQVERGRKFPSSPEMRWGGGWHKPSWYLAPHIRQTDCAILMLIILPSDIWLFL